MNGTRSSVLIDSGLLVLLIVGLTDRFLIGRHRRTREYSTTDYDLLRRFLDQFAVVVVTPNILTEVSNLAEFAHGADRPLVMETLAKLISTAALERYGPSAVASARAEFLRLGLADCATLEQAGSVSCTITADLDLYLALASSGHKAVNFNHLRSGALGFF